MPERMTVGALIEELQRYVEATGSLGDLTPVVLQGGDGPLRFKPYLELGEQNVYPVQTGERVGKAGAFEPYRALVIRGEYG